MSALFFSILSLYSLITHQTLSQSVTSFTIWTDGTNPGNGVDNLKVTLYWERNQTETNSYDCTFVPTTTANTPYTCDSNFAWTGPTTIASPNKQLPYHIKFEWDSSSIIQIDKINVTLDNGQSYYMDNFCIHTNMACTYNGTLTTGSKCGQWDSKDTYTAFALGGSTNFKLLYVDYRSDLTNNTLFADLIHEGSVRPPNLVTMGITTVSNHDIDVVSAQWDNVYYRCSTGINAVDPNKNFTCTIDESKACPGVNSSFWVSIYNPDTGTGQTVGVSHIRVIDETGVRYTMSQLCQTENAPFAITGPACTVYSSKVQRGDVGVGWFLPKLIAWVAPTYPTQQCIFNYPNVIEPAVEIEIIDDLSIDGWDLNKYGGNSVIKCPDTAGPTNYPTVDPTLAPTLAPTQPPSLAPSIAPSIAPTQPPSLAPSLNPSLAPTQPPSNAPSIAPTQPPSLAPSLSPSSAPTLAPSIAPSIAPSLTPTQPPSIAPSIAPTQPPSMAPSIAPSLAPSVAPSIAPSMAPSLAPTQPPSLAPSISPSLAPSLAPTQPPSIAPSLAPSISPSLVPSLAPSLAPSISPSKSPTQPPSIAPSLAPSSMPSIAPSIAPSLAPSSPPSISPSLTPSMIPSVAPSIAPSTNPSNAPSLIPTQPPSMAPSVTPTIPPSNVPSLTPSITPSNSPSVTPSLTPTITPTTVPSLAPITEAKEINLPFPVPFDLGFWELVIAAGALFLCCCLFCVGFCCYRRKKKTENEKANTLGNIATAEMIKNTTEKTPTDNTTGGFQQLQKSPDVVTTPEVEDEEDEKSSVDNDEERDIVVDDIKLQQAEGGDVGRNDTIDTMNSSEFVMDGVADTGNKDDVALDLILHNAPTQTKGPRDSVKFTV